MEGNVVLVSAGANVVGYTLYIKGITHLSQWLLGSFLPVFMPPAPPILRYKTALLYPRGSSQYWLTEQ